MPVAKQLGERLVLNQIRCWQAFRTISNCILGKYVNIWGYVSYKKNGKPVILLFRDLIALDVLGQPDQARREYEMAVSLFFCSFPAQNRHWAVERSRVGARDLLPASHQASGGGGAVSRIQAP